MLVASLGVLLNYVKKSEESVKRLKYSSKGVYEVVVRLAKEAFLRAFRRSSSSISFSPLLNIFYSFLIRKRFYSRRRFSFDYLIRVSLLVAS